MGSRASRCNACMALSFIVGIPSGRSFPFAVELLKRYLATGPVEEAPAFKAHYLLGMLLEKLGDTASAAQQYRASLALARNFGLAQQALNRIAR